MALQFALLRFAENADTCLLRAANWWPFCGHPLELGLERTWGRLECYCTPDPLGKKLFEPDCLVFGSTDVL